ncbi:MAG: RpiB/LacA/LacB family sugar-phosphate isomerase [Planctomycetota bacterium]
MSKPLRVAIDCDDAADELKATIVEHLRSRGVDVVDLAYSQERGGALYPEIGYHLAEKVAAGEADRGILMCGTGLGMAMIANKVRGVFAGTCHDVFSAERLKKSNDANVLTMGARVVGPELAKMIVDHYLDSEFAGGGSTSKVEQMRQLESKSFPQ